MKQRSLYIALLAVIAIICLLVFRRSGSQTAASYQHNEGTVFGTLYHAKYLYNKDLQAELEAELQKVDASLSMFNPQSTISKINRNETDETDEMLNEVLKLSFTIYEATDGAFDPTVAPLVNAWGFGFKSGQMPDSTQVDSLLALVAFPTYISTETNSQRTIRSPFSTSALSRKAMAWTEPHKFCGITTSSPSWSRLAAK